MAMSKNLKTAMQVAEMLLGSIIFILVATLAWFFLKVRRARAAQESAS